MAFVPMGFYNLFTEKYFIAALAWFVQVWEYNISIYCWMGMSGMEFNKFKSLSIIFFNSAIIKMLTHFWVEFKESIEKLAILIGLKVYNNENVRLNLKKNMEKNSRYWFKICVHGQFFIYYV